MKLTRKKPAAPQRDVGIERIMTKAAGTSGGAAKLELRFILGGSGYMQGPSQ